MGLSDKASQMADKAKAKAMEALHNNDNVDKIADKADEMTGGKHTDKIDKGSEMLKDKLGNDQQR